MIRWWLISWLANIWHRVNSSNYYVHRIFLLNWKYIITINIIYINFIKMIFGLSTFCLLSLTIIDYMSNITRILTIHKVKSKLFQNFLNKYTNEIQFEDLLCISCNACFVTQNCQFYLFRKYSEMLTYIGLWLSDKIIGLK